MGGLGSRSSRADALTHLHSIAAHIVSDEDLQPLQLSSMQPCHSQNSSMRGWHCCRTGQACVTAVFVRICAQSSTMLSTSAGKSQVCCK